MKITVLTLFPEMFEGVLSNSIIKRAIAKGCAEIEIVQIRDFTTVSLSVSQLLANTLTICPATL